MQHSLKKNREFSYIYKKGKRTATDHFTLFVVDSKYKDYRIGFSISKQIGKANKRNKLKRRLREICRRDIDIKGYKNYVLMCRDGAQTLDFNELKNEVKTLFDKSYKKISETK